MSSHAISHPLQAAKLERQNTALTQEVGKLRVTLHHPTPAADELPGLRRELEKLGNECRHLRSDNKVRVVDSTELKPVCSRNQRLVT